MLTRIKSFFNFLRSNRFDRSLLRYFDWPLLVLVLGISLFGVICIFSATSLEITEEPATIMKMLANQPITYPRLQLLWIIAGLVSMCFIIYIDYSIYGEFSNLIYTVTIVILLAVLTVEAGRGGMTAFFQWGSTSERSIQPSEFGKLSVIIAFGKAFSIRSKRIMHISDLIPLVIYAAIPTILVLLQPDFGTALVYFVVFCVMVFASGTSYKIILGTIGIALLMVIPLWYFMNNSDSTSFRMTRILSWLYPEQYPDDARQVINAQIAAASGGMFGKGVISVGSLASLGYISDDHTDFIFAVVCESFGFVGAGILILAYVLLLARLIYLAVRIKEPFGSFVILGVTAMFMFHIIENIGMVIGLLPVTGIPLPFMSYGGSNMLTNMMAIGLVQNVVMRTRYRERQGSITRRELRI